LYPDKPSNKDILSELDTCWKIYSIGWTWLFSLPEARFKLRKSTQSWISPFFFLTRTKLDTHWVCRNEKMILEVNNLFSSFFTVGSNLEFIFLSFCGNGWVWGFMGITCCIMFVSKVFKSLYVQANTSLNYLNNFMRADLSCSKHPFPRLIFWGLSRVPKSIVS